jgi:AraC-like DNA-binding protein
VFALQPGDLVLVPSQTVHSVAYDAASNSRLLLLCAQDYLPDFAPALVERLHYIYRNPDINGQLYSLLRKLQQEIDNWDDYSGKMVAARLLEMMTLMARNRNTYQKHPADNPYVARILEELNRNYATNISLAALAEANHISPGHLSRLFKAQTGLSFQDYLSSLRLKQARELLESGEKLSVTQIAARCGFNDSNYFSTRFRQLYGMSPLRYRKACRGDR